MVVNWAALTVDKMAANLASDLVDKMAVQLDSSRVASSVESSAVMEFLDSVKQEIQLRIPI